MVRGVMTASYSLCWIQAVWTFGLSLVMGIWRDLFEPLLCTQSWVMQTLVSQALYGLSLGATTELTGNAVLSVVTEK